MNCAKNWLISISLAITIGACTVAPRHAGSREASWDSGAQTSGLLYSTNGGFVITPAARARYNALAERYGHSPAFAVPVEPDYGVTPAGTNYLMSAEALEAFARMARWHKQETPQPYR